MSLNEAVDNLSTELAGNRQPFLIPNEPHSRQAEDHSEQHDDNDRKRYKYCCRKCKHTQRGRKACVCVVPLTQRRTQLGEGGCQTCSCVGCSVEDFISRGEDPEYKPSDKFEQDSNEGFQARNGCCRKCMKAFSKTNKACLCQVPRVVRKNELPAMGCKYCGCGGCNPEDKKQQDRHSVSSRGSDKKPQLRRYSSSESEDSQVFNPQQYNFNNLDRSAIGSIIINEYRMSGPIIGFGIPQRSYSYIMGKPRP